MKPRPAAPLQPHFTGETIDPDTRGAITRLLSSIGDERLDKKWMRVEAMVHAPILRDTEVERVHQVWNPDHLPNVPSPEGLPCLPQGTPCPAGSRLVEVSYIARRSGGMGSYHQFDGSFVSLVLAPDLGAILDARIEKAY